MLFGKKQTSKEYQDLLKKLQLQEQKLITLLIQFEKIKQYVSTFYPEIKIYDIISDDKNNNKE